MSISNLLADGNASQLDLKVNTIDCEGVLGATDITCNSLNAADEITATDRVFAPRIEAGVKLWSSRAITANIAYAGVPAIVAVSQIAGHVSVGFSVSTLAGGASATITLTNANFESGAPTFVNRARFTGAGEAAASREVVVCCSQATAGTLVVVISNTAGVAFAGNLDFDFIQF